MLKTVLITTSFCAIIAAAFIFNPSFNKTNEAMISSVMPGTVEVFSTIKEPFTSDVITNMFNDTLKKYGKEPLAPHLIEKGALGSGIIIKQDKYEAYIVTNDHVVENGSNFKVKLNDDTEEDATLIGTDKVLDIAVLKIHGIHPFKILKFADSSKVKLGEEVYAIGNPLGQDKSVSHGIVSNTNRTNPNGYETLIQTDAAINRGNSGGGLFNKNGDVIGINEEILSPTGASIGLGMAIPSNTVAEIANKIISGQHVAHPALGIEISNLNDFIESVINYPTDKGVFVGKVMNDSPNKEILLNNDVIFDYDGKTITNTKELLDLVRASDIIKEHEINVWRNGKHVTLFVKLKDLN